MLGSVQSSYVKHKLACIGLDSRTSMGPSATLSVVTEGVGSHRGVEPGPMPSLHGGVKPVWAELTIGNWIVITRLVSMGHWGR
jgi:hypothetical protein